MDMGGMGSMGSMSSPSHACKISMLWNWYTVDSCFIARSWHVKSRGAFAGSCIGVFFLVFAAQWLHRFCRELDNSIAARRRQSVNTTADSSSDDSKSKGFVSPVGTAPNPYVHTISHKWMFTSHTNDIIPTPLEHIVRSLLYTVEWGLSYIIMLLFMYYNGYIIISCILGALFGKLTFSYNEPLTCNDEEDRKCCR